MVMYQIKIFLLLCISLIFILILTMYSTDSLSISYLSNFVFKQPYDIYLPIKELNNEKLRADHPNVVKILRQKFLFHPSLQPYNLTEPDNPNPSMGQAQKIDEILQYKENGFYIECGALDGEIRSNTLFFERFRNWKGLLIEADPKNFELILQKNRKAYMSPTCLAPSSHPISVKFQQQRNVGHIVGEFYNSNGEPDPENVIDVQCFPLLSYLKALNLTTVDYFSLDVEGAEFSILKTIPWDIVDIKTLSVEFIHDKEDKGSIERYMEEQGYVLHSEVIDPQWLANDFIFVKKDFFKIRYSQAASIWKT